MGDVTAAPEQPKDGKYEVLYPVGLPEEGSFDWLDIFLKRNPQYTEISDRSISDWAVKSGVWKAKPHANQVPASLDKPDMSFGRETGLQDGFMMRKLLQSVAPLQKRHYIIMELKSNLIKEERVVNLKSFPADFKKIAYAVVGDPTGDFKKFTQEKITEMKQAESDAQHRFKMAEERKKKEIAKRQKEIEKIRKKQEREKQKAIEAAQKKAEELKKQHEKEQKKAQK